ncbi:MAG: SecF protein [Candidatus Pacebacteria bacterium GW2011_GWB1_47_8]|nr:MAG: SecF protein [Candidatus Pacebacteria bacterium GW2011_GWA1_46_10]KKU84336.1 MAG: SecF protein [Candidatus Pacebacteria bacterium GW2011_GWB1_47_8]
MRFMRYRPWFFALSLLVIIPGLVSLLRFGFRPAIDFTGGSLLVFRFEHEVTSDQLTSVESAREFTAVQNAGERTWLLRGKPISNEEKEQFVQAVSEEVGQVEVQRFETVGPTLGKELLTKMLTAGLIVTVFILLYVARQFKNFQFGLAAIIAMFHDSLVLLGSFSLLGYFYDVEIDVLFVTAMLTTLSFSVHDTIVVFDRIRELQHKYPKYSLIDTADRAISETLVRSLNNSLTIILMLLALVLMGGESIRWFAVALLIGAVTGTYSSTFTAVPLLVVLGRSKSH